MFDGLPSSQFSEPAYRGRLVTVLAQPVRTLPLCLPCPYLLALCHLEFSLAPNYGWVDPKQALQKTETGLPGQSHSPTLEANMFSIPHGPQQPLNGAYSLPPISNLPLAFNPFELCFSPLHRLPKSTCLSGMKITAVLFKPAEQNDFLSINPHIFMHCGVPIFLVGSMNMNFG